jgi:branched-chain amino acid transport system ATP-binding protein
VSVLLQVSGLEVAYGPVRAVRGVDLEVHQGEIRAILGANGAGKSSIIRAIMGLVKPRGGTVAFGGQALHKLPPHKVNQWGIAWVPEGRQVFSTLTVQENLLMGAFGQRHGQATQARQEQIMDMFPRLRERRAQLAGSLSGGEQQMLAIGRALMSDPRLLLMDEPSLGLAPKVVQSLFDLAQEIRARGISVLMAEQNARQALRVADYAYLLEVGEIRGGGSAREMEASERIRRVYLGG